MYRKLRGYCWRSKGTANCEVCELRLLSIRERREQATPGDEDTQSKLLLLKICSRTTRRSCSGVEASDLNSCQSLRRRKKEKASPAWVVRQAGTFLYMSTPHGEKKKTLARYTHRSPKVNMAFYNPHRRAPLHSLEKPTLEINMAGMSSRFHSVEPSFSLAFHDPNSY